MKSLSKEAEQVILDAIEQVCNAANDGTNPTDAVVKVANDLSLSKNYIRLVCTGYNTGATTYQREKSAGLLQKLAEFPLADADKAILQIFPDKVESPSVIKRATVVSDEYSEPPRRSAFQAARRMEKVAEMRLPEPVIKPVTEFGDAQMRMKKAYNKVLDLKNQVEEARFQYSAAQTKLLTNLGEFGDYMKYSSDWQFADVDFAVQQKYGNAGKAVMSYAHIGSNSKEKRSSGPTATARPVNWSEAPFSMVADCIKSARAVKTTEKSYHELRDAAIAKEAALLSPYLPPKPEPRLIGVLDGGVYEKESGMMSYVLGSTLARSLVPTPNQSSVKSPSEMASKYDDDLSDPQHDNELRGIQARTMLQDLLANDEVISGYPPNEVLDAYSEVSQLSPRSATQPAIIRPLLRKRLTQGAMEPFEAAELSTIEKNIADSTRPKGLANDKISSVLTRRPGILG